MAHLLLNIFIGPVKPEALTCAPVNAQRSTDGIAVPAGLQRIVLGEDFNTLLPALFDRYAQPQGKVANVDAAIPCWERLRHEYPEMPAPTAVLKGRFNPILLEVGFKFKEVRKGIRVIRINGHPLRALCRRVNGVQPDGDFAFEVATNGAKRKAQTLAGLFVSGPVVVMLAAFSVRLIRLEGVSPAVDEEAEVMSARI